MELSRRFEEKVRESRREAGVSAALKLVSDGFGRLHAPGGLAIRKLGKRLYECRTNSAWRLVFAAEKGRLIFDFAGSHDEVRAHLDTTTDYQSGRTESGAGKPREPAAGERLRYVARASRRRVLAASRCHSWW
jgi:hypothetical protein